METLSIPRFSPHLTCEVGDIRNHFSSRPVNQQLGYYQSLMDERKRGVAISTLIDGQDKHRSLSARSPRSFSQHSSVPRSPTAVSYAGSRMPSASASRTSSTPLSVVTVNSDSQKGLPSISSLDHESNRANTLHEEILARHGRQEHLAHQPFSSRGAETLGRQTPLQTQSPFTSAARVQQAAPHLVREQSSTEGLRYQNSPVDSMSYQHSPSTASHPSQSPRHQGRILTPAATSERSGHGAFPSRAHSQFSGGSQTISPESATPLSDILDKTHAQIASQRRRNDSAVDRAAFNASPAAPLPSLHALPAPYYQSGPDQLSSVHHHHHSPHQQRMPLVHQQHPSHHLYGQSPTAYHEHGHRMHSGHLLSSVPSSSSNVHVSNVAARKRRGNLPREAVRLFKKWVEENKRYPYPSESQKQDFERMTGLSMQQINNWFINARRRNLSERERAEMKREKERQSQSGSPDSSRPESSHGLPEPDTFSLDSLSRQASHSREHSNQGMGY